MNNTRYCFKPAVLLSIVLSIMTGIITTTACATEEKVKSVPVSSEPSGGSGGAGGAIDW